jgi:hypothetical protein
MPNPEGFSFSDNKDITTLIPGVSLAMSGETIIGSKKGEICLDGYNKASNIGYIFVSKDDLENWKVRSSNSTITTYYFKDTAKALSDNLKNRDDGLRVAVFYDPAISEKNSPEENMRLQVGDFIKWLKSQGII